jgi:phenylalanyl-tRNA synthetase alpha chain
MEMKDLISTLHVYERKVLPALKEISSFEKIAEKTGLQKVEVMRALQWLQNKKIVRINKKLKEQIALDENGVKYQENGLPEKTFLEAVKDEATLEEIKNRANLSTEEMSICLGLLRSKKAINTIKEQELKIKITEHGKEILKKGFEEENFLNKKFPIYASDLSNDEKQAYESLKKRKKILKINIVKIIDATPTELGKKIISKGISERAVIDRLTPSIIKSGDWKSKEIRKYDVRINVPSISGGKRHFVNQAIDYIKRIWLDLGFKEMTGSKVQTSFWDLDALFVPQDHPSRDMQDTFYIKDPSDGKIPKDLMQKVKSVHESGWTTGSKGWQYEWSERIARENLLRTHTTVLSAQIISKLKKEDLPAKYFSVGKVFRNETLSWKSLFEFIQVEGIVVDPDANFKNLKGYLKEFFAKMGFPDVRIRPAHFPYTEPSAEVDVWHPKKRQWVELGGSGIFRPEMVKPLLGFECPVLAWGLGMERTIMEYYDLSDVRDIYRNDLKQLREMKLWIK